MIIMFGIYLPELLGIFCPFSWNVLAKVLISFVANFIIRLHLRLKVAKKLAKEVDLKEVQTNINLIKAPGINNRTRV